MRSGEAAGYNAKLRLQSSVGEAQWRACPRERSDSSSNRPQSRLLLRIALGILSPNPLLCEKKDLS
jgi:hypothetical protein